MTAATFDKKTFSILSLLLLAATVVRSIALAKQSLWVDELVSWTCSNRDFWGALACDSNKPPLYYPLLHIWMGWFGSSEAALRSFGIPPGVISVWLIYLLGKKLFSKPVGYLAAAYQAFSAFQIYFAQEARNYTWLVFFLMLAGLLLWEALEAASRKRRILFWAGYTASITLALYVHYFAAFFIAGHGLYVLFRRRRQLLPATIGTAIALGLISPFVIYFMHHPAAAADQIRRFPILKFPQAYFCFFFGESLIPLDDRAVKHMVSTLRENWWILTLALGSLAILARYGWLAWKRWREPLLFAAFHASVPVVLAFLVSMRKSFFDRRYMIPASPYIYLLVAAAVWETWMQRRKSTGGVWRESAGLAATSAFCFLMVLSLYHYFFSDRYGKEQWREVIADIEAASSPDGKDMIVFDPDFLQLSYNYYRKRDLPVWAVMPAEETEASHSGAFLAAHVQGMHKVWLVYSHNVNEDMLTALRNLYPQVSERIYPLSNGIEVYGFNVEKGR